jgi:hypothetical protein
MSLHKSPTLTPVRIEASRDSAQKSSGPHTAFLLESRTVVGMQRLSWDTLPSGVWADGTSQNRIVFSTFEPGMCMKTGEPVTPSPINCGAHAQETEQFRKTTAIRRAFQQWMRALHNRHS